MTANDILKAWAYGAPLSDVVDRACTIASLLTALTSQANFYTQQSNTPEKAEALQDLIAKTGETYNRYYDELMLYSGVIDKRKKEV